jgi:hypothetical protein
MDDDYYSPTVIPAFFLGVFGMVVGFRITRSVQRSAEALAPAPSSEQLRVVALLCAALVPAAVGLVSFVLQLTAVSTPTWAHGTWSGPNQVAIFFGQAVVAPLGGALLGVAAAQWLRFPGAVLVPVIVVVGWVIVANGWYASGQESTAWLAARMFSPFAFFTTLDTDPPADRVETWLGQPWWYLAWLVALCAITVLVALLRDASGSTRVTLKRSLVIAVVVALGCFALAMTQVASHVTVRSPSGVTSL